MKEAAVLSWLTTIITVCPVYTGGIAAVSESGPGVEVEVLNTVLAAAPQHGDFVILLTHKYLSLRGVGGLRAPWGIGVFEVESDAADNNITLAHLSAVVDQATKLRQVSWSVTVVVVSDVPAFLTTFAEWCLKSRLLVWSTRLLVLTRVPLHDLQGLRQLLGSTYSILLQIKHTPALRVTAYLELPYLPLDTPPVTLAFWTPDEGLRNTSTMPFFMDKFTTFSQRPRLVVSRLISKTVKSLVVVDPYYPDEEKVVGYNSAHTIIETIAHAMNFSIKYAQPPDGYFGSLRPSGEWSGMLGLIQRQEAHIALGLFTVTTERHSAMSFTTPVSINFVRIESARGSPEVDPWGFLLPLKPLVWVAILTALLGVLFIVVLLSFSTSTQRISHVRGFNYIRILLQQDVSEGDGWWWCERVMVGSWMLMTLVLTKSYSGNLMSLLAVRHIPQPIQSLQDLVDSPYTILINRGSSDEQAFRNAESGILRDVWQLREQGRVELIPFSRVKQIPSIIRGGNMAYINLDIGCMRRMAKEFTRTGMCEFYISRGRYLPSLESMAVRKGSSLLPGLDKRVLRITEAGLYDYWNAFYTPNLTSCLTAPTKIAVTSILAVRNIWGMFVMLTGGGAVSIMIYGLEILYWRLQ